MRIKNFVYNYNILYVWIYVCVVLEELDIILLVVILIG